MRNFFFLLLTLSLFTFTACGDDDAGSAELSQESIVGDWNLTTYNNDIDISIPGLGESNVVSEISNSTVVLSFTAAGTWTSTGAYDITLTSVDTTETEMYDDGIGSGTYTVASNQLTISGLDAGDEADTEVPFVLNVRNFQENMLIELAGSVMETVMDPFFGLEISTSVDTEMMLER